MRLTVAVTYHNEKGLLTECLNSVESQLQRSDEILIYDDASAFPAKDYLPNNSRARIIRGETNVGPAKGRNRLLKEAAGDYIHFHDSDDWFSQDWYRTVAVNFGRSDAIFTEVSSYGGRFTEKVVGLCEIETDLLKFCILRYMLVPAGTYRTELVRRMGGYTEALWQSEDFDFHIRMALEKPSFKVIGDPLVNIRLRAESRSRNAFETNRDALTALETIAPRVPPTHWFAIAEKAAQIGSRLYQLGHREEARRAFNFSKKWGSPNFSHQRAIFRGLARYAGQEMAEWTASVYRRIKSILVPQPPE